MSSTITQKISSNVSLGTTALLRSTLTRDDEELIVVELPLNVIGPWEIAFTFDGSEYAIRFGYGKVYEVLQDGTVIGAIRFKRAMTRVFVRRISVSAGHVRQPDPTRTLVE